MHGEAFSAPTRRSAPPSGGDQRPAWRSPSTWASEDPCAVPSLVTAGWLADHASEVVLLQVGDDSSEYYAQHLPGALPLAALDELHEQVRRGPVRREGFEDLMTAKGVRREDHVVLYSAVTSAPPQSEHAVHAAFAYWVMYLHGHPRISLLDGGQEAWAAAGGALVTDVPSVPDVEPYAVGDPRPWSLLGRDELLDRFVGPGSDHLLLDCRTPTEYHGRSHHPLDVSIEHHRMGGHVPGAVNFPSGDVLDGPLLRTPDELRAMFEAVTVRPDQEVGAYCRVADRSALLWFALSEVAGHPRARHYVGGWAEYGSLVDVPVVRD